MRPVLAGLLLTAALTLVACGDDSETREDPAAQRAQFIATTDALCRASNARTKVLNARLRRVSAADDDQLLQRLAPILRQGSGALRANAATFDAARPPAADAREIGRIRELYDEQAELVDKLAAAAGRGDVARFKALSEEQKDVVKHARARTRAFGFKECGSAKSDAR